MNDEYREQGFIVKRGLVPPDLIAEINAHFDAIAVGEQERVPNLQVVRNVEVAKGFHTPETPGLGISKMNFFHNDPVFSQYTHYPALLDEVQALIGDDLIAMNSMVLNKPPNVDGRHPLHQDLLYFPFRPPHHIVGVWTALQQITRENGCLVMIPGSHQGELLEHDYPDWEHLNHLFVGVKGVDASERVHLEMEPGDTAFFHPLIIHGSGFNKTQGMRRAIAVHYANAGCEDIWAGEKQMLDKHSPRDDYRLVRGSDPHRYCPSA